MILLKRVLFFACLLKPALAFPVDTQSGFSNNKSLGFFKRDSSYHIQKMTAHWDLIFSEEFKNFSPSLLRSSWVVDKAFSSLFKRRPDFRTGHIFFSSPRYQAANALASFYITPFVQIYPSNIPAFMDLWSFFDWTRDTLIHELNHIYQFSQNSYWENWFWNFLGFVLAQPSNWQVIGAFTHRNLFLPVWILEGEAVLTESIYGSGGRLWSGASRAFVLAQIKEEKINLKRLLNFYSDSFSNMEKYLHGGFFFAYLESRYGLKKIKSFFYESAKIFPIGYYGLRRSFRKAFGEDINSLFEDYKKHYNRLAGLQRSAPGRVLFTSKTFAPINSDKENLFFLISDLKSPAELVIWNKKKASFKKRKAYLPLGKVFKREGRYLSAGNIRTGTNAVEYTLVREKFKPVLKYNSQYVMDFYQDQALSLDTRKSYQGNFLSLGGEFYDRVHSSALVDSEGSVYYFKQAGGERMLYKNKKPLAKFSAYFAYPVEATPKELYFIGPTLYGSSLFVYREGQGFYRLSDSDRIVSARKIKENQFLIAEIGSGHYEYKLMIASSEASPLKTSKNPALSKETLSAVEKFNQPVFYEDLPQKKNLFEKELNPEDGFLKSPWPRSKPYRAFSNLMVKNFGLSFFQSVYGFLNFEDPLNFNNLLLSSLASKTADFFNISYFHQKYRPQLELSLNYNRGRLNAAGDKALIDTFQDLGFLEEEDRSLFIERPLPEGTEATEVSGQLPAQISHVLKRPKPYLNYQTRSLSLGLSYPLLRRSEFSLKAGSSITVGQRKFNQNHWINYFNNKGSLNYRFARKYPYAYSFYKKSGLVAEYNLLFLDKNHLHLSYSINGEFERDLGRGFFLDLTARAFWALWNRTLTPLPLRFAEDFQWSYTVLNESARNLYQLDMTLFKTFNNKYRSLKIPVSFNRLAPLAGLSLLSFQKHKESNYNFAFIPSLGGEAELAFLIDQNIFKMGFLFEAPVFLSESKPTSLQFRFWIKNGL